MRCTAKHHRGAVARGHHARQFAQVLFAGSVRASGKQAMRSATAAVTFFTST